MEKLKILVFGAALREGSFNRKLASQAAALLQELGHQVDEARFDEFEMPVYDGDLEDKSGQPAGATKLAARLRAADAIVISTPEYNGGIPGALKNAIDWVSREDEMPLDRKPLLLIGASPGALGAVRGLWHTRVPLEALGTRVYPEIFGLPKAAQAFGEDGRLSDEKSKTRLLSLLTDFANYAKALAGSAA